MKTQLILGVLVFAGALGAGGKQWIGKRKLRYKRHEILDFAAVRDDARTGDIILFHKTSRSGLLDVFELDVLSPLLFDENEFRHCGIVVRKAGELFVMECADELHSGHSSATYLTSGTGIRLVPLAALLEAYNKDNGDPHFGIKHISREIQLSELEPILEQYGSINYLKMHKSAYVFLSHFFLSRAHLRKVLESYRNEMMCSEFVHSFLNQCGVLRDYPSKLFVPYYIEDAERFRALEIVRFSDIIRFNYSGVAGVRAKSG